MEELLQKLEKKIKELIEQRDTLKNSHHQVQQGKMVLIREKEAIIAKQQKAINQIEDLVCRLKALEKLS